MLTGEGNDNMKILGVSCGILEVEIRCLIADGLIDFPFVFLDSILHMEPKKLQSELDQVINEHIEQVDRIVLVYGDCHPYIMDSYGSKVRKVPGINCCEIVFTSTEYRKLRQDGAFFVFYDWVLRWKEVFVEHIGLTDAIAAEFMQSMHTEIIYINSGENPIPKDTLEEMSDFFGLPYKIMDVDLKELEHKINETARGEK